MKELHQCFCLSQTYSSQTQVTLHKVHSESSFQRCTKMQATLSFSSSPPPDPRVNVFSAYQVKHEQPPSPAYLRTDQKDQRAPRTVEFVKPRHNDTDNNAHCNKKHNSNYVPFFRKNREGEKVKNALRSQEDCQKSEELLKLEINTGTKPNGHELAMNKFSFEIRSRFLKTRGVRFLNGFPIGNNRSKSHFVFRRRLIIYKGNPATQFSAITEICTP